MAKQTKAQAIAQLTNPNWKPARRRLYAATCQECGQLMTSKYPATAELVAEAHRTAKPDHHVTLSSHLWF